MLQQECITLHMYEMAANESFMLVVHELYMNRHS